MNIEITDQTVNCLKDEWDFTDGEWVRVYARYAAGGSEPYVLGIIKEETKNQKDIFRSVAGGITFYIEEGDLWYLNGRNLKIDAEGIELVFLTEG
jgi:uncharacterized protein YneR